MMPRNQAIASSARLNQFNRRWVKMVEQMCSARETRALPF